MTTVILDTDHGTAHAHVHDAASPKAVLVLGHGAGGVVAAPDLVAARDIATGVGISVALIEQPYRVAGRRSPPPAWQLDVVWMTTASAPGRLHSEAAFARLAGTAPIPASSGKTVRHRLDRGGDRQLNRALHTIILTRRRIDPETKAYIARRVNEGKSEREATRCLKRYLARSLYRLLETTPTAS